MSDIYGKAALGKAQIGSRAAKTVDVVNVDLANNLLLDKTGKMDASGIIQNAIDRALREYPIKGRNPDYITYITVEVVIPPGRYMINKTITIDNNLGGNTWTSEIITCAFRGGGGGTSGVTMTLGSGCDLMFDFVYGQLDMENFRFFGHATGTFARVGRTEKDPTRPEHGGNLILRQSIVRKCEWVNFNKVWEIGLAFDWAFYDCGIFASAGVNPVGIDILPAYEPTNNIQFYRVHWEQMRGGIFFRAHGAPGGEKSHNNFGFFGCHFEARYWDTVIMDLYYTNRVAIYSTQITHNNSHGSTVGLTEANMAPMFKLSAVSSFHIYGSPVSRIGVTDASKIANRMFQLGTFCTDIRVMGGLLEPGQGGGNSNLNILWQSDPAAPYTPNGDPPILVDGVALHPRQPLLTPDRSWLTNPGNSSSRWGWQHASNNDLTLALSTDGNNNFSSTDPAIKISSQGVVGMKAMAGWKASVTDGSTYTFAIPNNSNPNRRGMFILQADSPGQPFVLGFLNGAVITALNVGTSMSVADTEGAVASKFNVWPVDPGNIAVKNLVGSTRTVELFFFGF